MQRTKTTHRVGVPHKSLAVESSLNDDSAEKRKRREERVANKHLERNKVVAAAATTHGSPLRNNKHATPTSPPRTPNGTVLKAVADGPHSPVRKVPILANFEEWMKMATDNVCICKVLLMV
jgi:condensin complex subunit 2